MVKTKQAAGGLLTLGSLLFIILSLSVFIIKNVLFSGWTADRLTITPFRWVAATLVPVISASWGHGKNFSTSGALLALIVGFILTLANYSFFLSLLAFFVSSNRATKYKEEVKKSQDENCQAGRQRNWVDILCSSGMALELCLLYLIDIGSADLPIDFRHQYRASWFCCAVLGSLAARAGDTWATQIGSVLAWGNPRLITSLSSVPRGTNGGVTFIGLISSFIGGLIIGLAYYIGIMVSASSQDLNIAPDQLLVILIGGLGGLLGSIIDSVLGASLQFSGEDIKTGRIVEVAGQGIVPIAGKMVLDNHSVNVISSILTALLLPKIAVRIGL